MQGTNRKQRREFLRKINKKPSSKHTRSAKKRGVRKVT